MIGVNRATVVAFNDYKNYNEEITYKVAIYLRLSRDDESIRRF